MNKIIWDDSLFKNEKNIFYAYGKFDSLLINHSKLEDLLYAEDDDKLFIDSFEICVSLFVKNEKTYNIYFYPELEILPLVKIYIEKSTIKVKTVVKSRIFPVNGKYLNEQEQFSILINYGVDINTINWNGYKQLCEKFLERIEK